MRSNILASGLAVMLGMGSPIVGAVVMPEMAVAQAPVSNQSSQPQSQLTQAKAHFRRAEFRQAIGLYQKILASSTLEPDSKIDALLGWSEILLGINQTQAVEENLQQALKIARESRDRSREGEVLAMLGWAARSRQDYPKSQEYLNQSLTIAQQIGNKKGEARSVLLLGTVQYLQGDYPKALATFQSALKVAQATNNQDEMTHIYAWMASAGRELKEFKSAEDLIEKQIILSRAIGYRVAEIDGLLVSATLKNLQNKPDQAVQLYQQAMDMAQSADNSWTYIILARELAWIHVTQKETDKALSVYQNALVVAKTIDEPAVADIMNRMGVAYGRSDQYPQALEAYQQALKIYLKTNQKSDTAQVFSNIGHSYKQQKLYPESREAYQQALVRYEAMGNQFKQSETLSEIGYGYLSQSNVILNQQKDYSQARKLAEQGTTIFQKQRVIAEKISDRTQLFYALIGIGQSYKKQGGAAYRAGQYAESLPLEQKALSYKQEALKLAEKMKNAELIASAQYAIEGSHFGLINTYDDIGQPEMALEHLEKARKIVQILKKPESEERLLKFELTIYLGIANSYTNPTQNTQKLKAIEKIIALSRQLKQPETELVYLNTTAQIYYFWGQYDRAWDTYQQVLKLSQTIKNPKIEILALLGMGQIFDARADYPKALALYQKSLEMIQFHRLEDFEIPTFNNISNIYKVTGQYPKALEFNQKAKTIIQSRYEIYKKGVTIESIRLECLTSHNFGTNNPGQKRPKSILSEACNEPIVIPTGSVFDLMKGSISTSAKSLRTSTATNFSNLGVIYGDQGEYLKSIELYQKALEISRELKDTKSEALNLNNLASTYSNQGSYSLAFPLAEQAVAMSVEQKNQTNEVTYRSNLAAIYASWGNYPKALENYQQVLALAEKLKTPGPKAVALRAIGNIYNYQGQYTQAIEFLQKGLAIDQEIGNPTGIIMAEAALARVYLKLGQSGKALELGQQSLARSQAIGAGAYEIEALQNLAEIYVDQGDFKSAQASFQRALELADKSEAIESKSLILFGMANINLQQNQPKQALDLFQQALSIQQKIGVKRATAQTLNRIGQAQIQLNNPEANDSLQSAIVLAQSIGDLPTQAKALANLADLATKQNQNPLAIVLYKQSVIQYEVIRKGLAPLPKDQQESYTKTVSQTYRNLADLLIQNDRLLEAQQILGLLKLQEIKDYSPTTRNALQENEVKLSEVEQEIAKKYGTLIAFRQKLDQCQGKINNADCEKLDRDRDEQGKALNDFLASLKSQVIDRCQKDQVETCLTPSNKFTSTATKLIASQPGSLIIMPVVLDNKIWILTISDGGLITRYESNVDRLTLGKKVLELRQQLETPNSDIKTLQATSKQLYDWLIKPIEPTITAAKTPPKLIFALDRVTRYIPMGVLYDGQQYLTQRYPISTILSIETTNTNKSTIGNPNSTNVLALGLSKAVSDFRALPSVNPELASIVQKSGIYPGQILLDRDFTRSNLSNNLKNRNILHIATHGKFDPTQPKGSFLVLGNGDKLPIADISTLDYSQLDLVVLSACQTALGNPDQDGTEIPGISSHFLNNGAASVMASLWSVDDSSTALMMQSFYRNLSQNKPKNEALRQAQSDLLKLDTPDATKQAIGSLPRLTFDAPTTPIIQTTRAPGYSHPYYWAPFILIGNSQ
jgi:CHAT domain-containing protein/tetratricopeptide (TPR) repeat protein